MLSCFFDIFNPSFFIFLGLLILSLACFILYFESKWREQNHKISSMVSLVSSLAEEVNHTKLVLSTLNMQQQHQIPIRHSVYDNSNDKDELIAVSDDDEEDEDGEEEDEEDEEDGDEEDEEDEEDGGLREIKSILFDKTMHHANMKLNEIDLNEEEDKDTDVSMLFSQGAPISLNQIMASILQNAHMVPFRNQVEELEEQLVDKEQLGDKEQLVDKEQLGDKEQQEPVEELKEDANPVESQDIKSIDLSSINISNEPLEPSEKTVKKAKKVKDDKEDKEDKEENEETDLKKMSIQRLRTIVLEKQLSPDPSKLKKPELLKLLSVY